MLICLGAGKAQSQSGGGVDAAGVPSHRKLLVVRAKGEKIFSTLPAIMLEIYVDQPFDGAWGGADPH